MILRFLKPNWRKLLIAALDFSGALDKAIREAARQDLAASVVGQGYKDALKRIYQDVRCEANEQAADLTKQFMDEVSDKNMRGSLERRASILGWMGTAVMAIVCYLLACIACTGAVIRLREKA